MTSPAATLKVAGVIAALLGGGAGPHRAERSQPSAHAAVIGGVPVGAGTLTSVVKILDFRGSEAGQCTGTVVAPTLVLTAGHCAENPRTGVVNRSSGYMVLTGGVEGAAVQGQVSKVFAVIVYDGFHRKIADGDAALLVLSTPVSTPPIRLATGSDRSALQSGSTALIAGFGETRFDQLGPPAGLRSASTVVQGSSWCNRNAFPFYTGSELCTIDPPTFRTGACLGDSGGPLLARVGVGGELVQIGIASHVYGRCSTRLPSVFTRVDPLAPWVQTWIDAYKPPPLPQAP
jgi:secreted trypsin-like serine protease